MAINRIFLIVTTNDVGFIKTDPGVIPQGQKIPRDQYIFPSLLQGEIVEFITRKDTGWLYIKRCNDGFEKCANAQYGYVDWRYVALHCIEYELSTVTIYGKSKEKLTSLEIDGLVYDIEKLIYKDFRMKNFIEIIFEFPTEHIPLVPPMKVVTVVEIEAILDLLTTISNNNPPEDFAEIMMRVWDDNKFYLIVGAITYSLAKKYPEAFFRICSLMYFTDLNQLMRDFVPDMVWEERKKLFRWPTLSDPNPIDKASLKKAMKDLVDVSPDKIDHRTFVYFSIKQHQIDYLLRKGGANALVTLLADLNNILDAGIQLLFKEDIDNPLLEIIWGLNVRDVWDILKSAQVVVPLKVQKDNNGINVTQDLFVTDFYEGKEVKSTSFKPEMIPATNVPPPASQAEKLLPDPNDPCAEETDPQPKGEESSKEKVKTAVITSAAQIHDFILSKVPNLLAKYPSLISDINLNIASYRSTYYEKLSLDSFDRKKLDKITAKDFNGKHAKIANKLTWCDLVYIWFYNLGSESLGTAGNELKFGTDATTTKEIRNHATMKNLYQFTLDRISQANNRSAFTVFAQYDAGIFFQAVKANDIVLNFLGSFTVEVKPHPTENKATFKIINTLGLESFSRFRKGNEGILTDVERTASPDHYIKMGGTMRCLWEWEESV